MSNNGQTEFEPRRQRPQRNSAGGSRMQRLLRARKPLLIERLIRTWGGRILGAMREDGLSAADEAYESNQTSRDFLWNTIGLSAWGIVFPVLTVVITQLVGAEEAGKFALAFVAGHLLMFVANYGVRTYPSPEFFGLGNKLHNRSSNKPADHRTKQYKSN